MKPPEIFKVSGGLEILCLNERDLNLSLGILVCAHQGSPFLPFGHLDDFEQA